MAAETKIPGADLRPNHPARIHQYQLGRVLGRGGMGTVFEAFHSRLKRRVALKVLSPQFASAPDAVERFEREMAAIGQLSHPHIVQALDAGVDQSTHYLAMEFVDGQNVEELASRSTPIKIADACQIARNAALGLSHAHTFGVIHRDVKPANLLLSRSGELKVADLGLARFSGQVDGAPLTESGAILGTYDYMSPEQIDGQTPSVASDLYSLGATLYRLLAGRPVFFGPDFKSGPRKMAGHLHTNPPSLVSLRSDVPPELETLVLQLLEKQPSKRPPSAKDVADRLLPHCEGSNLELLGRCEASVKTSEGNTQTFYSAPTKVDTAEEPVIRPATGRMPRTAIGLLFCTVAVVVIYAFARGMAPGAPAGSMGGSPNGSMTVIVNPPELVTPPEPIPVPEPIPEVSKAFQEMLPSELEQYRWYSLLEREPVKLAWNWTPQSLQLFDAKRLQVRIISPSYGLSTLGRVEHPSYTLQVDLYQSHWLGGFAILLGIRETPQHDGLIAQAFKFDRNISPEQLGNRLVLIRSHLRFKRNPDGGYAISTRDERCFEMAPPAVDQRMLEIEVQNHDLAGIRWGNEEHREFSIPESNGRFSQDDYIGDFGIYVIQSEVSVSNPKMMVFGNP